MVSTQHQCRKFTDSLAGTFQTRGRGRLLHPQHLDGIWTGQTQYRLPYAPLSEYPEPWSWKVEGRKRRALASFGALKKTESQTWGRNAVKKKSPHISLTLFFSTAFPPHVWDSVFFQSTKTASALDTPSCNFSEPGFWILTKGGIRQPVVYQPYPNSIQVLGMEQPSPPAGIWL